MTLYGQATFIMVFVKVVSTKWQFILLLLLLLFIIIYYFHIFKEGSPSAMLIFKGPSITKLTKLNTIIT